MTEVFHSGKLPVLALRGLAVFPNQTTHFDVGRDKSAKALEAAMKGDQIILLVPQRDIMDQDPHEEGLFPIGTVARVKQVLKSQGENLRVLVSGICRAELTRLTQYEPYLSGFAEELPDQEVQNTLRLHALLREANNLYGAYIDMTDHPPQALMLRMMASDDAGFVADAIAQNSNIDFPQKIQLLMQRNPVRRIEMAIKFLRREIEMLHLEEEIQEKTRANIDQNQREYYLREQLHTIRTELGEEENEDEFDIYALRIHVLHFDRETEEKLLKDVERLKKQPFGSAEGAVLRNYLDTVLELPWHEHTKERVDVSAAQKVLARDHFGMEKVKERILETIAVRQLAENMPPQILCLVGPPGVGKTSISYSISRALNRKMARISLGGVHDEADIRGHRKTYVGAMPGRIISALTQAGSMNPVILLDEIDKMGADHRGDPSAALLEVLDGEQNHNYRDHYLEIPVDLSDVLFIATANTLDTVPRPLLDRMEIIELSSYTDEEKLMIAKDHLISKQLKKHGIKRSQLRVTDDAIREMITCYTRESGVRSLERKIGEVCRKAAMAIVAQETPKKIVVTPANIEDFLGVRTFLPDRMRNVDEVGLVTGLAWTSVGGETLEVEVNVMDGNGKLELTGNLGDVMKESAHAALSYIRANAQKLGIDADFYKTKDIHVHFPEGAVPKDGPSAGITVCTAIVSALTGQQVRRDVAMTGEISLRGRVMAIGGLKEKTMAALRHGIHTVIIPEDNARDLSEIDQTVRNALEFIPVSHVEQVLQVALKPKAEVVPTILSDIPQELKRSVHKTAIRQ